jgi:MerR family copper efflux transcriptional regulator
MNIGKAAERSGVSAKMIRYYESVDLLPAAGRSENGYRSYTVEDVARLSFVRRSRDLGFSIERIRELLGLWGDQNRSNSEVRSLAKDHVAELEGQAARLQAMIQTLRHLMRSCEGAGERALCPIIDELSDHCAVSVPDKSPRGRRAA